MIEEIALQSHRREELVNIDRQLQEFIRTSGIREGLLTVFAPHTTAAITINENADPDVAHDIVYGLGKFIPHRNGYRHYEGNSDAHIKATLVGQSEVIIVSGGKPLLGTWQSVYFCEFDGPRTRRVILRIE
jgi:secondary thiamine-phosphate synthase enzyme